MSGKDISEQIAKLIDAICGDSNIKVVRGGEGVFGKIIEYALEEGYI